MLGPCLSLAQLPSPLREIRKPGTYGAQVHDGALAPVLRKWYLPQQLYYEFRWRGWEYTNFSREQYQRYIDRDLDGTRQYDPFGNYISRGWLVYNWTERNPIVGGSSVSKQRRFRNFFNNVLVSSASKGEYHTALTVGDAIRTTLTPLTFSKPSFNGLQWDFLSDKYGFTLLASRISGPAFGGTSNGGSESTRVLGGRISGQVGDFARVGMTWVNAHHADSEFNLGQNSLRGLLTRAQNLGHVNEIKLRISDDSPESPESGAILFLERIRIDGLVQTNMRPLVEGGVREAGGVFRAAGGDVITLTYDIRNSFSPTTETPGFEDIRRIEFELVMANDYKVEVGSNKTPTVFGTTHFLPVFQAEGNVADGSNQRFLRFEYGLPTATEVVGIDLEMTDVGGFSMNTEYVVNRRFQRFPNQSFQQVAKLDGDEGSTNILPAVKRTAEAFYLAGSYQGNMNFAYGEAFYLDPDYTTTAFIPDSRGRMLYDREEFNLFEFVDDNDDQDLIPDWRRASQGVTARQINERGSFGGGDLNVFPGLDENNDLTSDFNQNANLKPDYAEPFLRYAVDAPEFLFGMDMNNNTIIDRFEDDEKADLPYEVNRSGYNFYGGRAIAPGVNLTVGRTRVREISSDRKNRTTYGLLTTELESSDWELTLFEQMRWAKDQIKDDRLVWRDTAGIVQFDDPLDAEDAFINSFFSELKYIGIFDLNVISKIKYEKYYQRGESQKRKQDRSFFGMITKADYEIHLTDTITLWPKVKSQYQRLLPSSAINRDVAKTNTREETLFLITRYKFLPQTWVDVGLEYGNFNNLKDRTQFNFQDEDDFRNTVLAVVLSNTSAYVGYRVTMNAGFTREKRSFSEVGRDDDTETTALIRLYAATGES